VVSADDALCADDAVSTESRERDTTEMMRCLPGVKRKDAREMIWEKWWCVLMIRFLPGVKKDDALSLWCLPLLYGRYVFMSMYSCVCMHIYVFISMY